MIFVFENRIDWNNLFSILTTHISAVSRKVLVPIQNAQGMRSAEHFTTPHSLPRFSRSLVDGYAVSGINDGWQLVAEKRLAEESTELEENQTVYIPTGGMLPSNTEKVIKIEHTTITGDKVTLLPNFHYNQLSDEIEREGVDFPANKVVLVEGEQIDFKHITTLAAYGRSQIWVYDNPRISIIVTGQEVLPLGADYETGKVYDATSAMLVAFLQKLGINIFEKIMTSEDFSDIKAAISAALPNADIIITTGGTSMGKHDNVYKVLQKHGDVIFHGINVRPGKPMLFSKLDNTPILSFPGFVTSSIIMASIILPKVVSLLIGSKLIDPVTLEVELGEDCKGFSGWYRLLTGKLVDKKFYSVFKTSSAVSSFTEADGYIVIPPDVPNFEKNSKVLFYYF